MKVINTDGSPEKIRTSLVLEKENLSRLDMMCLGKYSILSDLGVKTTIEKENESTDIDFDKMPRAVSRSQLMNDLIEVMTTKSKTNKSEAPYIYLINGTPYTTADLVSQGMRLLANYLAFHKMQPQWYNLLALEEPVIILDLDENNHEKNDQYIEEHGLKLIKNNISIYWDKKGRLDAITALEEEISKQDGLLDYLQAFSILNGYEEIKQVLEESANEKLRTFEANKEDLKIMFKFLLSNR
ncbi:hypothetical protein DFP93_101258 [Aneurinibacillus soli]|uniref:Uncharacterized protein n=1 Tax=Aneurinibacillus soli TaxID=1500254 RepID=A0A0U5AWR2_9BACL|nr:hypothetical protein [Aneurinibacillus soli]PYE64232.1 hypothetical protein DFP93_101258 [Aneurinibacillus soli]BAU28181.1 hypothetical protein CB4_02355 [Aneurinibacillus soli]